MTDRDPDYEAYRATQEMDRALDRADAADRATERMGRELDELHHEIFELRAALDFYDRTSCLDPGLRRSMAQRRARLLRAGRGASG